MTENSAIQTLRKARSGRSPSYPSVSLRVAVERAQQIWDNERQHAFPAETLPMLWGYKSLNGPAGLALAALIKFGLLTDDGTGPDRTARLTDLAVEILRNPSFEDRARAVRTAALNPPIHRELWESYQSALPSDANLHWMLQRERGFTETGAREFIREYKDTIAFARLRDDDDEPDEDTDVVTPVSDATTEPSLSIRTRRHMATAETAAIYGPQYAIPLMSGGRIVMSGSFPISESDWAQLMAVLEAMKPGLVKSEQAD